MVRLKLMRLPRGTNRNRSLRRAAESGQEDLDFVEVEELFRRFWRSWQQRLAPGAVSPQAGGRGAGGVS